MKIYMMPQYSGAWWAIRRGRPTASAFERIITSGGKKGTPKYSEQSADYAAELIGDMVSLTPPFFSEQSNGRNTPAMQAGIDTEPEARRFYAMDSGNEVREVGFCMSDDGRYGCSPDGLIGLKLTGDLEPFEGFNAYEGTCDGVLELKCPLLKTQSKYLLEGGLPPDYRAQVHGHLIVTGSKWVDFVSYSQNLPALRVRVEPDDYTGLLKKALDQFWDYYSLALAKMKVLAGGEP